MKMLLAAIVLTFAACGGGSKSPAAQRPAGSGEARVDPTLPSWLPESCVAYHKAVVQAIDCQAVDPTKRDEIQKKFGEASEGWKAEQNADKAKVDEVAATCTTETASVRAELGEKCI